MAESSSIPPVPKARRKPIVLNADIGRVITRPYIPPTEERIRNIIDRVLNLDEDQTNKLLATVLHDFSHRHRYFRETLKRNYSRVVCHVPDSHKLSEQQQLLIGSYFTAEYSVEAAALFNPSMVQVKSLETDPEGSCRFIMSFRAIGEGHISSIEFRSGIIDKNNDIYFDPQSHYVRTPRIHTDSNYDRELFELKLRDMGVSNRVTKWLLSDLADNFTFTALQERVDEHHNGIKIRASDKLGAIEKAMWLARSNYEILFQPDHQISERVLFPRSRDRGCPFRAFRRRRRHDYLLRHLYSLQRCNNLTAAYGDNGFPLVQNQYIEWKTGAWQRYGPVPEKDWRKVRHAVASGWREQLRHAVASGWREQRHHVLG
jgi:hypothetical protein